MIEQTDEGITVSSIEVTGEAGEVEKVAARVAENVAEVIDVPTTRREFLQLALMCAGYGAVVGKVLGSPKKEEPSLPPTTVLLAGTLFRWSQQGTAQDRERRGRIALAVTGVVLSFSGIAGYLWSKRGPVEELVKKDQAFKALPSDWQKELRRRAEIENQRSYELYRFGIDTAITPFNITDVNVIEFAAKLGPGWFIHLDRRDAVEAWLGRTYSDQEIQELRAQPDIAGQEVIKALRKLKEKEEIAVRMKPDYESLVTQEVINFYEKVATPEGRKEVLDEYLQRWGPHLTPTVPR